MQRRRGDDLIFCSVCERGQGHMGKNKGENGTFDLLRINFKNISFGGEKLEH